MASYPSNWVSIVGRTTETPQDTEPRNFRQTSATHNSITVTWERSEDDEETGYDLEIEKGGIWEAVGYFEMSPQTISYLEPSTDYNIRIRSVKK